MKVVRSGLASLPLLVVFVVTPVLAAPLPPVGVGVTHRTSGTNRLVLSWSPNTEADLKDYGVYLATFSSSLSQKGLQARLAASGTTHQDAGLTDGTTYYYQITARDAPLNESGGSAEVSGISIGASITPPAAPAGLVVTQPAVDRQLNLGWTPNTEPDLHYYKIYRATFSGSSWQTQPQVAEYRYAPTFSLAATLYHDTGLQGETTYYYLINAVDTSNRMSVGASAEAWGVTRWVLDTIPPAAIGALTALVGASDGQIGLMWTAPGDDGMVGAATAYELRRATSQITTAVDYDAAIVVPVSTASSVSWVGNVVPAPAGTASSATIVGLIPGVTYYFSMKARDEVGNWSGLAVPAINWAPARVGTPPGAATTSGSMTVGSDPVIVQLSAQPVVIQAQTDTKTQIVVPPSVFTEAVRIGIRPRESLPTATVAVVDAASAKVGGRVLGTKTREFTAAKLDGSAVAEFGRLVDVYLPYDDADRDGVVDGTPIRAKDLKAHRLDEAAGEWKVVADGGVNEVDDARQVVHVQLKHFSLYTVGLAAPTGLGAPAEKVTVGPNPARAGAAPSVWFYADWPRWSARVRWFGPDGSPVAEINEAESSSAGSIEREAGLKQAPAVANVHRAAWAGRNAAGARVASGVYVVETAITNLETGEVRRVLKKVLIVK